VNENNKKELWKLIIAAGDFLKGKLPEIANHPKGRNTYAHVSLCIKNKFGYSYKDLNDAHFKKVVEYIDFLKNNPS
jgi:hypothetical protein